MMRKASPGKDSAPFGNPDGGAVRYCPLDPDAPFGPTSMWEQLVFDFDLLEEIDQYAMVYDIAMRVLS